MNRLIDNHQAINGPGIYLSGIPMPRGKFPLCHYLSNYQQLCGCSTRHSCWGQICENHRMWSLLAPLGWARQSIANNWRKRPVYDISQLTRSQRIGVALRLMIRNWKHGLWMRIKYDDPFTCCIRQIEIANGRFFLSFFLLLTAFSLSVVHFAAPGCHWRWSASRRLLDRLARMWFISQVLDRPCCRPAMSVHVGSLRPSFNKVLFLFDCPRYIFCLYSQHSRHPLSSQDRFD